MKYVIGFVVGMLLLITGGTLYNYAICEGIWLVDCRPEAKQPL